MIVRSQTPQQAGRYTTWSQDPHSSTTEQGNDEATKPGRLVLRTTPLSLVRLSVHSIASFPSYVGLRYDDILREETDIIREAINRLPENELYERVFRMKTACQYSLSHTIASKENAVKPEDDIRYLTPVIEEVAAEFAERADFNNIKSFSK